MYLVNSVKIQGMFDCLCGMGIYLVLTFLQHPDYGRYNDIAILEVDGEVAIDGTFVDTIPLAQADAEDFVGAECEIAGWDWTEGEWQLFIQEHQTVLIFVYGFTKF